MNMEQNWREKLNPDSTVLIVGASGGIGRALLELLDSHEEVRAIYAASRSADLEYQSKKVTPLQFDYTSEDSIQDMANRITDKLDLVLVATGYLYCDRFGPERRVEELRIEAMQKSYLVNVIGPSLIGKYILAKLNRDRTSWFAALSARVGSISDNRLGGWYSYRSAKSALNMILKGFSIETARKNKKAIIAGLHPGTVDTKLSRPFQGNVTSSKLFEPSQSATYLLNVLTSLDVTDSGKIFAWDGEEIHP